MTKILSLNTTSNYSTSRATQYNSQAGVSQAEAMNNLYVGGGEQKANITNLTNSSKFLTQDEDVVLVSSGSGIDFENQSGDVQLVALGTDYNIDLSNNDKGSKIYFQGSDSTIKLGDGDDFMAISGTNVHLETGKGQDKIQVGALDITFNRGEFFIKQLFTSTPVAVNENILKSLEGTNNDEQEYELDEYGEEYDYEYYDQ